MQTLLKLLLLSLSLIATKTSFAYQELPFCPSGGPTGWMNYFDYKRNQNIWRQHYHNNYAPITRANPYQYRQLPPPVYNTRPQLRPYNNTIRPFTHRKQQPYSQYQPSPNHRKD